MITIHPRTTRTTLSSTSALMGGDSYVSILGAHRFLKKYDCKLSKELCENGGKKGINDAWKPLETSTRAILDMCKIMIGSKKAKIDDHPNQQISNLQWEQGNLSMPRGCVQKIS
jgi:hypothetical protein